MPAAGAGPRPLRVLVVDDEPPARKIVTELLASDPEVEVVDECGSGDEAVAAIGRLRPDLVFLDVQMPGRDGFEVLAALDRGELPAVIFVTAYDRYALQAFEVHALDYLLKPFDDERFAEALERAKAAIRNRELESLSRRLAGLLDERQREPDGEPRSAYAERLMIRSGGRVVFVPTGEIEWIEADDYYAKVHAGGKAHLMRESLASLERQLDPRRFARVHRSAIVNLERVQEMHPGVGGGGILLLQGGARLPLSRRQKSRLEKVLSRAGP